MYFTTTRNSKGCGENEGSVNLGEIKAYLIKNLGKIDCGREVIAFTVEDVPLSQSLWDKHEGYQSLDTKTTFVTMAPHHHIDKVRSHFLHHLVQAKDLTLTLATTVRSSRTANLDDIRSNPTVLEDLRSNPTFTLLLLEIVFVIIINHFFKCLNLEI